MDTEDTAGETTDKAKALLAARAAEWRTWLSEGRLGKVLRSIDSLPPSMDREKPFLRIQMLHRAGLHAEALKAIEELTLDESADPVALVRLARISADAGVGRLAVGFLEPAIDSLDSSDDLERALAVAVDVGSRSTEEAIARRFEELFPDSPILKRRLVRDFVAAGQYGAAAAVLTDIGEREARDLFLVLQSTLQGDSIPDYVQVAHELTGSPSWLTHGLPTLVNDAIRRGEASQAFDLLTGGEVGNTLTQRHVVLLLDVIEALLLESRHESAATDDRLRAAVAEVVRYLSTHATDGIARTRLTRLLSPELSGTLGLALIASISLDFVQGLNSQEERPRDIGGFSGSELLEDRRFVEGAFAWLDGESPIVIGRSVLPESLLTDSPDALIAGIADALTMLCREIHDERDVQALRAWLVIGASLAPHTSNPNHDLRFMRLVGGALANAGRVQQARDLAETALHAAGPKPARQQIAWSAMADIYHRVGNYLESLIAIACAAAGSSEVDLEESWYQSDCLVRLLRDIGLYGPARSAHLRAGDVVRRMKLWESNRHRHELLGLQIEMLALLQDPERISNDLPDLAARVVANAGEVLDRADDPAVVGAILGQLLRIANENGIVLSADVRITFDAVLERIGTSMASLVRATLPAHPTPDEVLLVHQRTAGARYAEDVAFDSRHEAIVARRLLTAPNAVDHPEHVALAIEVLADRAIAAPSWESTSQPSPPINDVREPAEIARAISADGVSLLMAALDRNGCMVSLEVTAGQLGTARRESPETFASAKFEAWQERFPYRYGTDDQTPNLFYVSTEGMGVSTLPPGPVLLVMDPELQQLPPNLLRIGDDLAALTRPMASAPSLSWLRSARSNPVAKTGRRLAWISTDDKRGQTLPMIAQLLTNTLADHAIQIDTGPALPQGFADSDLVVVAAHGGIGPEGRYFQRVSDEGQINVAGGDLARTLRNIGVVILFVCSGGRIDRHPMANTTIGLVRQVLHQGCSTVIASPWPLDALVPYHWLPAFLDAWKKGMPLIDANFEANLAVDRAFSGNLAKRLAMNVFGDPLKSFPL